MVGWTEQNQVVVSISPATALASRASFLPGNDMGHFAYDGRIAPIKVRNAVNVAPWVSTTACRFPPELLDIHITYCHFFPNKLTCHCVPCGTIGLSEVSVKLPPKIFGEEIIWIRLLCGYGAIRTGSLRALASRLCTLSGEG